MKKQYLLLIITVVLILKFKHIRAQDSTYFQQKVDYKIAVELDDELHTLKEKQAYDGVNILRNI